MESVEESNSEQNIVKLIKQLILEKTYDGVTLLFETPKNLQNMSAVAMELYTDICLVHLTEENYRNEPDLYRCVEGLLKVVATHAPIQVLMIELMEKIEEDKSECVFTSMLRALQIVLQRHGSKNPRAIEWCLQSVYTHLKDIPLPKYLTDGYDCEQARLLEQDEQVQSLLTSYIMVSYFYEPLLKDIVMNDRRSPSTIFRDCSINRRNVFCCFFVQLLGGPLSLLDLTFDKNVLSNSYTQQRVENLVNAVTECIVDPYYLLSVVEARTRWPRRLDIRKDVYEMSSRNIFHVEEKLPLSALAIYYHALFTSELLPTNAPKVYSTVYFFETGLYLSTELLKKNEPALQHCGLRLIDALLSLLKVEMPNDSLELTIHKEFCGEICKLVSYSPQVELRQLSLRLLKSYIDAFNNNGKYIILENLINNVQHNGLLGYLAGVYKDMVARAIFSNEILPDIYTGELFRSMFLKTVCILPNGVETDLIPHSDTILSALNIVRYFAIADKHNRTGFWHYIDEVERKFLTPLRTAIDLSLAHLKANYKQIEEAPHNDPMNLNESLKLIDVHVTNSRKNGELDIGVSRKEQLDVISFSIMNIESILSLLGRTNECLAMSPNPLKLQKAL